MTLQVVHTPPPQDIYDACEQRFKVSQFKGVIWTVGAFLHNPDKVPISPWLFAHEQIHSTRQLAGSDVSAWWTQYLDNPEFRFEEELVAHREEWRVIKDRVLTSADRQRELRYIVGRLSGKLYGNLVKPHEAKMMIMGAR